MTLIFSKNSLDKPPKGVDKRVCILVRHKAELVILIDKMLSLLYVTVLEKRDHLATNICYACYLEEGTVSFKMVFRARKTDFQVLRYINLNIRKYVQTLVECLPLFACTEKRVLPRSGPFSQILSHMCMCSTIHV